jgi:hypothetical protein
MTGMCCFSNPYTPATFDQESGLIGQPVNKQSGSKTLDRISLDLEAKAKRAYLFTNSAREPIRQLHHASLHHMKSHSLHFMLFLGRKANIVLRSQAPRRSRFASSSPPSKYLLRYLTRR